MSAFKRYVFWNLRVIGHVPGYRRLARFWTRKLEENFWRNYILSTLISWTINALCIIGVMKLVNYLATRDQETVTLDLTPEEARDLRKDLAKV